MKFLRFWIALLPILFVFSTNADEMNDTALRKACETGDVEKVKELLDKGANGKIKDKETGTTSMMLAAQNGHAEVVKILLEKDRGSSTRR
jgi:ankyrin repeat protein